jgi:sugar lactone lactonase YvrE
VIGTDGKVLGLILTPRDIISLAFSGPDKKTLYIAIPMIAQGYKGRAR